MTHSFSFVTTWTPATDTDPLGYGLELTNTGDEAVTGFQLAFSGPSRLEPGATVENGKLVQRLSNHTVVAPPEGYVLNPATPGPRRPGACPTVFATGATAPRPPM